MWERQFVDENGSLSSPWDGIAGKFTPGGRFSIGGPKEVGVLGRQGAEGPRLGRGTAGPRPLRPFTRSASTPAAAHPRGAHRRLRRRVATWAARLFGARAIDWRVAWIRPGCVPTTPPPL